VVAFILLIFDRKLSNDGEALLVSQLTLGLLEILGNKKYSIAIITPYNMQRNVIKSLLHAR
jgi:superfamily I DNA and/or RNA helicase